MSNFLVTCFLCLIFGFLCLTVESGSINSLRNPLICGQPACSPSGKFKYSPSITYHYDYNVTVNTWFAKASENQSTLSINAEVVIEFITKCEGLLSLYNVTMVDQDENYAIEREEIFGAELTKHTLRFAFHDGVITELCPQEKEEDWSLNFKRGVLSLFQNTMERFDINHKGLEHDIHGTCDTEYRMKGQENTSLIVMKSKNLAQCMDRYKYLSILQTVRYNFESKYQTWPVLQSESRCRITIDHNVYKRVSCRERHLFEPFSGKQSGAMTTVIQELRMIEELNKTNTDIIDEQKEEWAEIKLRNNLFHNHISSIRQASGELKTARDVLKQLCKVDKARSEKETQDTKPAGEDKSDWAEETEGGATVGLWGELVKTSRALHYATLSQLLTRSTTICSRARKHILDALPYIASVGSVELIKDMIIKGTVNDETRQEWLMSMAMIPRPQRGMLVSMYELMKNNPTDKYISLAASSMVHSFCRNSKKSLSECCQEKENMDIIEIFQKNINEVINSNNGNLTRTDRQKMAISIKSLGNIGGFTDAFRNTLMGVIENPEIPISIRVHSVDAFRKTPCHETRSYFLQLFREHSIDVEIRLHSYLQVMRCPKYVIIREILQILRKEKINQVASFVWSHLENLGKSTIPSRVEKQGLLSGNTIPRPEHRPDVRKFSRNYEHGVFFDQYNAGGNYEANIIMSPDSYIPRSASLNLTVDMFGESINILELNARGEGFEKYIENIFGSNGPLGRASIEKKLQSFRFMRSPNEADETRERIDNLEYKNDAAEHRFPMLDLGMKVFGNEISYWNAEGDEEIQEAVKELNPLYHINKILSGKEISYAKASMFLDTTYAVPTGCGLALNMNLMGTSVVNLKMSGSLQGADKFFETKNLDFEGKMHPSMAVNVAATMSVNGGGLGGTGIRVNMRLLTATALAAQLKLRSSKLASLTLSLPHTKQEIFEARSELIVLHGTREIKQLGISKSKEQASTCSWETVDIAIGIKMCATYEFPNMTSVLDAPYFLMAGPSKYSLTLEKVDPTAKLYKFLYSWDKNSTGNILTFSFDTPGSLTKRMFNSSIIALRDSGTALMSFQSADHFLKAHATYKNLPDLKHMECVLDIDGHKHFDAVLSIQKQEQKNGHIYVPRVYVAVNSEKITELAGTLRYANKKGVSQCDVSLEFQTKKLASRLIGYLTWNGPSKGAKLRLDYHFLGERKETIKIEALVSDRELGNRRDFYSELGLEFTSYPHLNFFADAKYMGTPNHIEFKANLSSSRESQMADNVKFHYDYGRHTTYDGFKLHHNLKIQKPFLDVIFDYEDTNSVQTLDTKAFYDKHGKPDGMIAVWGRLYNPLGTKTYIDAALNVTLPSFVPLSVEIKLHEKNNNELEISAKGIWFTGLDAKIMGVYQDSSSPHLAAYRLKAIISSTKFDEAAIEAKYNQDNKQISVTIKGEQLTDKYSLMGRFVIHSPKNFTCYGQLDVKSKTYSVSVLADMRNDTNILADIHIDQLRDVHITYVKLNHQHQKSLKADINWDANRDPNQKVSVEIELLNRATLNYAGSFALFYPGRLINGEFDFLFKDWLCQWLVQLGWSPEDKILWKVKLYSEIQKETVYALLSEMDTPFPGWRDTSLNFMWRYVDNLQAVNGNMTWEKEKLVFSVLGDYLLKTNEVFGEISALINSTLPALPTVAAVARHHHQWRKSADTLLSFEYNNDGLMMMNSSWRFDRSATANNVSGRVAMKSPFQGYRDGLMVTMFMLNQKKDLQGLTHINLEDRIYTITVDGHARRLTNSMLVINVTSPLPAASLMEARLGFSDTDRHAVAMIKTPNMTTGAELLLKLTSLQDFHMYGHLALPVEFLNNAMVQLMRNSEEVDFRVGWDKFVVGFTGIWHYNSLADFQYLYKVFIPSKGFEENGLVLKNIYRNGLDSEVSLRLSKHKLGVALLIKESSGGLLKTIEEKYFGREKKTSGQLIRDFSSEIIMIIDTLDYFYETINFHAQLQKVGGDKDEQILRIKANLEYPKYKNKSITLVDKFVWKIYDTSAAVNNELHVLTPYKDALEIKSTFNMNVGKNQNVYLILLTNDGQKWNENSIHWFYERSSNITLGYGNYLAKLKLLSDSMNKSLDAMLNIRSEDTLTKLQVDFKIPSFHILASSQIEMDDAFIEASGALNLTSPYIKPYLARVEFKKDFTDTENNLVGALRIQQGSQNNYFSSEVTWRPKSSDDIKLIVSCSLIPVIPPLDMTLAYVHDPKDKVRVLRADARVGSKTNVYTLNAEQRNGVATIAFTSPLRGFRNLSLVGEMKNNEVLTGVFRTETAVYNVNGKVVNKNPLEVIGTFKPEGAGETYSVRLQSAATQEKYTVSVSFIGPVQFLLHASWLSTKNNVTEFSAKIDSSHTKTLFIKSRVELTPDHHVVVSLQSATPFQSLNRIDANADVSLSPKSGSIVCIYNMTNLEGDSQLKWSFSDDNMFLKALGKHTLVNESHSLDFNSFYLLTEEVLPEKSKSTITDVGFNVNLDEAWKFGSNGKLHQVSNKLWLMNVDLQLPKPDEDLQELKVSLDVGEPIQVAHFGYSSQVAQRNLSVTGKWKQDQEYLYCNLTGELLEKEDLKKIDNKLILKKVQNDSGLEVVYDLYSPYYKDEETMKLNAVVNLLTQEHLVVKGTLNLPASRQIADIDMIYGGLKHTVGKFNTTTPFNNLPWLAANSRISNGKIVSENIVEFFWPNQTALFNSSQQILKGVENSSGPSGVISLEIPINTKHILKADYAYLENEKWSDGNMTLFYNDQQFVHGKYKCVSDIGEKDLLRDTVDISLENEHTPVGVHYVHQYDNEGHNDIKLASIYELGNSTNFNITGRLDVEAWKAGKKIKLMTIQGNRTFRFENKYEAKEKEIFQGSKLEWAPNVWLHYDVHVQNKTTDEDESQEVQMNIHYPKRSFGLLAIYKLRDTLLDGVATLDWALEGEDNKTLKVDGRWFNPDLPDSSLHDVRISLSHPSFAKDVTLLGKYTNDVTMTSNISVVLEYSDFENEKLTFNSVFKDNSNGPTRDYRFEVDCKHPATSLDFEAKTIVNVKHRLYHLHNNYKYQKTLFDENKREKELLIDMTKNFVQFRNIKDNTWYNLNTSWFHGYPEYKLIASVDRTTGNDSGLWILSVKDKSILGHFNMSDDVSYHLIGQVNDARSAEVGAWRDFDDVKTIDISSYIRLNHSRLLTSRISWRPEMYGEVKASLGNVMREFYSEINEALVLWKSVPMEMHSIMKNVWNDAKPRIRDLLNDLTDLHVIKDDFEDFQVFLNESYGANEFYIKNIVEFAMHIIDELSLRNHIESLPDIINEMWQMMGDTGQSLRASIIWIVETLKNSYEKLMERINKFLETDVMDQVAEIIEAGILKYDSFVKKIHLAFISYCETTWANAMEKMSLFWRNLLKSLEPTFLKFTHYLETFLWKFNKELIDFLYARTNEITESPYFNEFTAVTQDLDRLWKEMRSSDAISNIKRITEMALNFINKNILIHVPFQKELKEIATEIWYELNQLQELKIVKFVKARFYEGKERLKWWYDYFQIGKAMEAITETLYQKITETTRTALQNEEEHRVAKTNFIFDPRKGLLLLEQKLPVPWHAFNRTPDFTQISEYKMVHDFVDTWLFSNFSAWSYYYELMPYSDIYNLLPPFPGRAIITGHGTIVTMDRRVFTLDQPGTFLLTADFLTHKFAILVESDTPGKCNIVLLGKKDLISIDLFEESVTVGKSKVVVLPSKIDEWTIERDEEIINIDNSNGVSIECKYLFKTCVVKIEGWYYSQIGGLFGTMNNEPYDDMLTPKQQLINDLSSFVNSWRIAQGAFVNPPIEQDNVNETVCEGYFKNKVSPLKACFLMIDSSPFYEQCIKGLDPCVLANSYMEICNFEHIPLRTPEKCVECKSTSGLPIEEGTFDYQAETQNSTDVVFMIEDHGCNKNIRKDKNIDLFVNILDSKLNEKGFANNRYAIVGYGGLGMFKTARALYVQNRLFVNASEVGNMIDIIKNNGQPYEETGDKSNHTYYADTFEVLHRASSLLFRPGVPKTLFLFPCTKCDVFSMRLEYSVVHQVLLDSSVTLHIIMDDDFSIAKKRVSKNLFGIDSNLAYTAKDVRELVGDQELRQQIKIPKAKLGFCSSLAMETNGTIFAGSKLHPSQPGGGRRAAGVLAARAAASPLPCRRTRCECNSARLTCSTCSRHLPRNLVGEFSLSMWDTNEMDDFIDDFLDITVPIA